MGKAFGIIALVLLILVGSCAGCLYLAYKESTSVQEDFYAAVATGNPATLKAMFHPSLHEEVDDAMLAAWMKAMNERLGAFTGMAANGFNLSINHTDKGKEVKSEGTAEFEKGTAQSLVRTLDDKIVQFNVESETLGKDWFQTLDDRSAYDAHARSFLEAIRAGDADKAWGLMHSSLQADAGKERWPGMVETLKAKLGGGDLELARDEFVPGPPPILALWYGGDAGGQVKLEYRPQGMKLHLVAFSTK